MSTPRMVKDRHGHAIQCLADDPDLSPVKITVTAVTARGAIPVAAGGIVRIASTQNCYIAWGGAAVDATTSDHLFPAGTELKVVPEGATHLAAIRDTADGVMTVSAQV